MNLPKDFIDLMTEQLGEEEANQLFQAIEETTPPTSIRINPAKGGKPTGNQIPWCPFGYYLEERPQFTLDPLFHAGTYYVQEASSMFLWQVIKQNITTASPIQALDLCAAPGGKSTLALSALPEGSTLICNEPIRQRAQILRENIIKWGYPNTIVTSNYPADFKGLSNAFDVIICDAPCSGEGMFRKDPQSISEWSIQNVHQCVERQQQIISDIWDCLRPGGLFIYSTCTYNHFEDEDNINWIIENFDAEILPLHTTPEWGITNGHFFPHKTKGEGFYIAAIRKEGDENKRAKALDMKKVRKNLHILLEGIEPGKIVDKRKGTIEPSHSEAMSVSIEKGKWNTYDLSLEEALTFLRTEPLSLPSETPRGYILVQYDGHPLGFVKNIGSRANNLYPQEWRIRKL